MFDAPNNGNPSTRELGTLANIGFGLQAAGAATGAVGAFYGVKNQQLQMEQQASTFEFQSDFARQAASQAEREAQFALRAGMYLAVQQGLQAGQEQSATLAQQGASGVDVNSGSAREVRLSQRYAQEMDRFTITLNSLRQSQAARRQRVNAANQATLLTAAAQGQRIQARAMNPLLAGISSLVGSGGSLLGGVASAQNQIQ